MEIGESERRIQRAYLAPEGAVVKWIDEVLDAPAPVRLSRALSFVLEIILEY